jgi:spore germination cell wall hydrolase CwlJ-like protein
MCHLGAAACLTVLLLAGLATAAEQAEQAQAAESKAEALEKKAAAAGNEARPTTAQTISKTEAQAVDPSGEQPLDDPLTCLARTLYWETKGENHAAMAAVANVVMNRLGHEGFPHTACGVVKQGQEEGACQFSWWCDGRPDDVEEEGRYTLAKEIARRALNGQLQDRTGGALYFHHQRLHPSWSNTYTRTAKVGAHLFYKPHGGDAK